ncbi:hypothetical protein O3P69_003199 [Scylla paramamosain]|uniref:Uncharacterized protein n=1 Tax=Scylla paramamosain TaxID=85552 RepID=A0AAW0UN90_SCYPA
MALARPGYCFTLAVSNMAVAAAAVALTTVAVVGFRTALAVDLTHLPALAVVTRDAPLHLQLPMEALLILQDVSKRLGLGLVASSLHRRSLSFPSRVSAVVGVGRCSLLGDIQRALLTHSRPALVISPHNCSQTAVLRTHSSEQQQHHHLWPCIGWVLHEWLQAALRGRACGGGCVAGMPRPRSRMPQEAFEECLAVRGLRTPRGAALRLPSSAADTSAFTLRNATITLATIHRPPFTMLRKDHNNVILSAYGLCFSMLELLSQTLEFKYRLVEVPDNGFGALQEDGSWDGMVGMVLRKEADGAVASFTVNLARSTVIDYTHPYFEEPTGILIPPPTSGDTMASFLMPFSWQVWVVTGIMLVVVGWLLHFLSTKGDLPLLYPNKGRTPAPLSHYVAVTGQALVAQYRASTGSPRRLVVPRVCTDPQLLGDSYRFPYRSQHREGEPLFLQPRRSQLWRLKTCEGMKAHVADSLAELTEQTKVVWAVRRGSIHQLLFMLAEQGIYAKVGRLLEQRPDLLVGSDNEGLQKVRSGGYAFIKEMSFLEFAIADDLAANGRCSFGLAGDGFFNAHISWIFQKHSPITAEINSRMVWLAQSGLTTKWRREFFPPPNECTRPTVKGPRRLSLEDLSGCFTLAAAGMLLAAMVLLLELLVAKSPSSPGTED